MRLRFYGLVIGGLALPVATWAQAATPQAEQLTTGAALVREGVALHDQDKYPEAIARYQQVLPGDSAYAQAQAELALSLMAAKQYQASVEAAQRSRALQPFEPELYATMGTDYEELKKPAEARQAYAAGLKLYPYNENLWINQGILELNLHQLAAALPNLERATELRPLKASDHRLLGKAAAEQGQTAHAFISLAMYLALNPDGENSQAVLIDLERLAQGVSIVDADSKVAPVAPNGAFAELDQLLAAKVALTPSYTTKVKFQASLVKQLQLLVEKFPTQADPASDFWVRTYAPVVDVLRQPDNLATFTYFILSSADDKSAAKWVTGNKSRVITAMKAVFGALQLLREKQPLAGAAQPVAAWFDHDGQLEGLGPGQLDAKGDVSPSGKWVLLTTDGSVRERGEYTTTSKRTGRWQRLRPDGTLESETMYNAGGELEGPVREYYPGGQLKSEATYKAGKLNGLSKRYHENGQLRESRQFADDQFEGEAVDYTAGGQPSFRAAMHADKKDGPLDLYYPDGTLRSHAVYAQDKLEGERVEYYPDKTPQNKATYLHDEANGPFTSYHANGQVNETGQFGHGKRTGLWHEYYADGKPSVEETYDEQGELHGVYHDYDRQGRHFSDSYYDHGRLTRTTSLDASGKPRADIALKKGRVPVKNYDLAGRPTNEGSVENGHLIGEWNYYYPDGTLREIRHYTDQGIRTGVGETYYTTGQLHERHHYAGGEADGYSEEYTLDGQLSEAGYESAGQAEGIWKSYYPTGQLSQERQLFRGDLSGPSRSYTPGGKITEERLYTYGKLHQLTTYDSTGQVVDRIEVTPQLRELVLHYPGTGHQVLGRAAVANGEYEGPSQWLLPNGTTDLAMPMRANQRSGTYRQLYPSGQLRTEGGYLSNKPYGAYAFYYPSGKAQEQGQYRAGQQVGEWKSYFENGQLARVLHYDDDGNLDGDCPYYNPAGELLQVRRYEHDRLVAVAGPTATGTPGPATDVPPAGGPANTSFASGKPAVVEDYAHGYPSGPYTFYYASGQVFQKASFVKGLRSGPLVSYWPSGKLLEEENFLHGERHGRCRYYRPDGTLERQETYLAGELAGPSITYDAQGHPLRTVQYWNNNIYNPGTGK